MRAVIVIFEDIANTASVQKAALLAEPTADGSGSGLLGKIKGIFKRS